ncbi:MAG: hypothetical protein HRT40_01800 [Campylobacteraceae bacterium]|nr:hypothetical protein [Campylobacteraceae bacterium]
MKKNILMLIFINIKLLADENTTDKITTYSFTLLEVISLSTAIISICLGIFAIWLTLHLKNEADSMNKETKNMLMEIKIDARTVTSGVIGEMEKWGNLGREILTSSSKNETQGGVNNAGTSLQTNKDDSIKGTINGK